MYIDPTPYILRVLMTAADRRCPKSVHYLIFPPIFHPPAPLKNCTYFIHEPLQLLSPKQCNGI